jgi:hypothetical protein
MATPNLSRGGRCEKPPIVLWAEALRAHPDLCLDIAQAHKALRAPDDAV